MLKSGIESLKAGIVFLT